MRSAVFAVLSKMWTSCFHTGTLEPAPAAEGQRDRDADDEEEPREDQASARVIPSASGGRMWCIQDGAAGPRSFTKTARRTRQSPQSVNRGDPPKRESKRSRSGSMVIGIALFGFLWAWYCKNVSIPILNKLLGGITPSP